MIIFFLLHAVSRLNIAGYLGKNQLKHSVLHFPPIFDILLLNYEASRGAKAQSVTVN